jgi:hypothetical protein
MKTRIQSYKVLMVAIAVLFGASVLILGNTAHFAFASPTTGGEAGASKMHLGEAMKALQAGDNAGAEMHAQVAQDSL